MTNVTPVARDISQNVPASPIPDISTSDMRSALGINVCSRIYRAATSPFFRAEKQIIRPYIKSMIEAWKKAYNRENTRSLPERIWDGASFLPHAVGSIFMLPLTSVSAITKGWVDIIPSFYQEFSSPTLNYRHHPDLFPKTVILDKLDRFYTELIDRNAPAECPLTANGQYILHQLHDAVEENDHKTVIKLLYTIEKGPSLILPEYAMINTRKDFETLSNERANKRSKDARARSMISRYQKRFFLSNSDNSLWIYASDVHAKMARLAKINAAFKDAYSAKTNKVTASAVSAKKRVNFSKETTSVFFDKQTSPKELNKTNFVKADLIFGSKPPVSRR